MIEFLNLNQIPFQQAREIQTELISKRQQNLISDTVLYCEHPPTLTRGIRSTDSELLVPLDELNQIEIIKTDRGGQWTAHEPGQLVLYPVIDLRARRLSPKCFVSVLLDTVCSALKEIEIKAVKSVQPAGIFVSGQKIASIGLRISKGVTNHGISINVSNSLEIFKLIVPCGLSDTEMTTISRQINRTTETTAIIPIITQQFINHFGD